MLRECTNSRRLIYLLSPSGTSFLGSEPRLVVFFLPSMSIEQRLAALGITRVCVPLRLASALRGAREKSHKSLYKGRGGARRLNGRKRG